MLVSALLVAAPLACRSREGSPQASSSAHVANPKAYPRERLTQALASVQARWQTLGTLPDCSAELKQAAERERCALAQKAYAARRASTESASDVERMQLAADAALQSQRASSSLREAGVTRLLESRPATSASAQPAASVKPKAIPTPSALKAAPAREQSDPYLDAIQAQARVVSVALAELRAYLEFGDRALRAAALAQVERLAREEPHWAALRGLVNEAWLVEADAELKTSLAGLRERLGTP